MVQDTEEHMPRRDITEGGEIYPSTFGDACHLAKTNSGGLRVREINTDTLGYPLKHSSGDKKRQDIEVVAWDSASQAIDGESGSNSTLLSQLILGS